jgi:hypothetical protein
MATKGINQRIFEDESGYLLSEELLGKNLPPYTHLVPRSSDEQLDFEESGLVEARLARLQARSLPCSFLRTTAPHVSLWDGVSAVTSERGED